MEGQKWLWDAQTICLVGLRPIKLVPSSAQD